MDYFKKIERSVTISADKRSTVDLQVDVWSQDLNVTKFILKLDTTDSAAIDLTNATVRVAMFYSHDGQNVKIEAAGIVEDVATQKIGYIMGDRLAGFEGQVTAGFYVTLSTGQRIDIQNVTFNMRKSLLDKDLDVPTEDYYQTFDDILADVRQTGDTAKSNINAVLPDVQSKVAAINTELAKIDENMPDLFVAYADDSQGSGFSKTDTTKLYKGFSVKNSNLPVDYRWERNVDRLIINGRNLLLNSGREVINKDYKLSYYYISPSEGKLLPNGYGYLVDNKKYTIVICLTTDSTINEIRLFLSGGYQGLGGINLEKNKKQVVSLDFTARYYDGKYPSDNPEYAKLELYRYPSPVGLTDAQYVTVHWIKIVDANGVVVKDWSPAPEDVVLQSNPINSILTTLSQENPSTIIGGTWTQLGTETKFDNTIYYWKRTN